MVILENIDIDIDIDKAILQNIDIDKISNRFKFGISNRARWHAQPCEKTKEDDECELERDHHRNVQGRAPKFAAETSHVDNLK